MKNLKNRILFVLLFMGISCVTWYIAQEYLYIQIRPVFQDQQYLRIEEIPPFYVSVIAYFLLFLNTSSFYLMFKRLKDFYKSGIIEVSLVIFIFSLIVGFLSYIDDEGLKFTKQAFVATFTTYSLSLFMLVIIFTGKSLGNTNLPKENIVVS